MLISRTEYNRAMKLWPAILLCFLVPVAPVISQVEVPVITLQQSIDATLANGQDAKILQWNLEISRAQHALNVSRNSLSLSANAGYGMTWPFGPAGLQAGLTSPISAADGPSAGISVGGPLTSIGVSAFPVITPSPGAVGDTTSAVGVNLSQTLWNGYPGGSAQATVDKSLLTLKGKELATAAGRLSLVYGVKQAYYAVLAAQRNLALKHKIFDQQDSVLRQITAIYDMKLASLADLKTAQLNARSAQADVNAAENDLRNARVALATYMAFPLEKEFTVADAPDPAVAADSAEAAVAIGLAQRVEIKQIELNVASSHIDLALARGQATPSVSVSGGVNVLYDWNANAIAEIAGAGVTLSLPVLDAGAVQNQVEAILRQDDVYTAQAAQLRTSISSAIRAAWQAVELARERRDVAQLGVEAMDLQYQLTSVQRDAGTASNQDLLTAAVNLANAETALAAAQSAAQLAVLQLQNLMGN